MSSDKIKRQENDLCSPPSWEALAAAIEDSDEEIDDRFKEDGMRYSVPRTKSMDDNRLENSVYWTDVNKRPSSAESLDDPETGRHAAVGDYINIISKGCLLKQPISHMHRPAYIGDAGAVQDLADDPEGGCVRNSDPAAFSPTECQVGREPLFGQRSVSLSDRDSESVYDTVSSTSSAAPLLRKISQYIPSDSPDTGSRRSEEEQDTEDLAKSKSSSLENIGKTLLAKTLEQVKKSLEDLSPSREAEVYHDIMGGPSVYKVSRIYLKNLAILSLCFMILHTAFFSLRNLQSSINHESGLGLAGLSCLSASYIASCLFAPSVVQKVRPKYALIFSMTGHLLFQAANFYSSFYTIIPASLLLGCTMASLWVAQGSYLTSIAVTYATVTGNKHEGIIGLFNGFFLFCLQAAQIVGNLLSSFVFNISIWSGAGQSSADGASVTAAAPMLPENSRPVTAEYSVMSLDGEDDRMVGDRWAKESHPAVETRDLSAENRSFCGATYCHSYRIEHPDLHLGQYSLYVLLGVFLVLTLAAMVLAALFLDKLDVIFRKNQVSLKQQVGTLVRFHRDYKVWLLVVLLVFVGMQQAYMFGEVTKAFITCPLGVHMIGYVMVCFGACDSLVSFACGQLQRCSSTKVFITIGAIIHFVLLGVMLLWQPTDGDVYLVFLLAGGLGAVDAIWQTQICNLIGCLFPTNRETAFGCLRMYEGIGFTLAFAYAQHLCMAVKTYLLIGVLFVGLSCYYVMEHLEEKYKTALSSFPPVDV